MEAITSAPTQNIFLVEAIEALNKTENKTRQQWYSIHDDLLRQIRDQVKQKAAARKVWQVKGTNLRKQWVRFIRQLNNLQAVGESLRGHACRRDISHDKSNLFDRFGQKRVILVALAALTAFFLIVFFAPNAKVLLVGEILCGIPWGIFATSSPAYASEVLPLSLRVYMTSLANMCFVIGQLIASGVLTGMSTVPNQWAYRVPFAIQWFWPTFLLPILLFAPESPWYLVRKGRLDEARHSLEWLHRSDADDINSVLSFIIHTDNQEQELLNVKTTYRNCFQGVDARRTEIACIVFLGQVTTGPWFAAQETYFFEQVGLNTSQTYHLKVGGNAPGLFFCIVSWIVVIPNFGRGTIYLSGTLFMTIILFLIALLNVRTNVRSVGIAQAVLTLVWTCVFQATVGQVGWSLPAEVSSTRFRQKTIVLGRNTYYIGSVIASVLEPYFLNPTAWNFKGYTGFFLGGTSFLTLIWAFYRLLETKGRSFEDLNILFANRVPTRQFKLMLSIQPEARKAL